MTVKLSKCVASWDASLHNTLWDSWFKLAWYIIAFFIDAMVVKPNSAKWFCLGVSLAVYLNWMLSSHATWSLKACTFFFLQHYIVEPLLEACWLIPPFQIHHMLAPPFHFLGHKNSKPCTQSFRLPWNACCFLELSPPHLWFWLSRYQSTFYHRKPGPFASIGFSYILLHSFYIFTALTGAHGTVYNNLTEGHCIFFMPSLLQCLGSSCMCQIFIMVPHSAAIAPNSFPHQK